MLLNCLAFLWVGFLAHGLALRLGRSPERAKWLALLVALWPPSFAYSSTVLKDSLNLLAVFALLAFLTCFNEPGRGRAPRPVLLAGLGAVSASYALVVIRPELATLAVAVALLSAAWSMVFGRESVWARWRPALGCLLVTAGIMLGVEFSPVRYLPQQAGLEQPQDTRVAQTTTPARAPAPSNRLLADSLGWAGLARQKTAQVLEGAWQRRWEYAQTGGISLVPEAHVLPDGPQGLAIIFLGSLRNLILYPLPWQSWPSGGGNLPLRAAVAGHTLLWYLLLPGLAWGLASALGRGEAVAGPTAFWVIVVGLATAVIVVNLGTLYRLRDMALLPLLLFFSPAPYQKLTRLFTPRRDGSTTNAG